MTESELMEYVRGDFRKLGYETYAEVSPNGTGGEKRCDMYARNENEESEDYGHTIAFEAKLTFNFKVLQQAYNWKKHANNVYVVVPSAKRSSSTRQFARIVAEKLGVGVIEVSKYKNTYNVTVQSEFNPNPKYPKLYEQQKHTLSSIDSGEFITAFKITVMKIDKYMENKTDVYLSELVKKIDHHYSNDKSAMGSIKKNIERNIIKGYTLYKKNNKICIRKIKQDTNNNI